MPISRDEFSRRLSRAFDFLGDLLRNPERVDELPDTVRIPGVSISYQVTESPGFTVPSETKVARGVWRIVVSGIVSGRVHEAPGGYIFTLRGAYGVVPKEVKVGSLAGKPPEWTRQNDETLVVSETLRVQASLAAD
jgi:hypothetical protein